MGFRVRLARMPLDGEQCVLHAVVALFQRAECGGLRSTPPPRPLFSASFLPCQNLHARRGQEQEGMKKFSRLPGPAPPLIGWKSWVAPATHSPARRPFMPLLSNQAAPVTALLRIGPACEAETATRCCRSTCTYIQSTYVCWVMPSRPPVLSTRRLPPASCLPVLRLFHALSRQEQPRTRRFRPHASWRVACMYDVLGAGIKSGRSGPWTGPRSLGPNPTPPACVPDFRK